MAALFCVSSGDRVWSIYRGRQILDSSTLRTMRVRTDFVKLLETLTTCVFGPSMDITLALNACNFGHEPVQWFRTWSVITLHALLHEYFQWIGGYMFSRIPACNSHICKIMLVLRQENDSQFRDDDHWPFAYGWNNAVDDVYICNADTKCAASFCQLRTTANHIEWSLVV